MTEVITKKILHIDSSIFGDQGVSNRLGQYARGQLEKALGDVAYHRRDLTVDAIPHVDGETLQRVSNGTAEQSDVLIQEFLQADILLLGVPTYNFNVPSPLKAWIDHVARAGVTFKYTEQGPVGLSGDKTVIVFASRGGFHQGQPSDIPTQYLKVVLGFLGLTDIRFIYAEGLNLSAEQKQHAITQAKAEIDRQVATLTEIKEAV